MGKSPIGTTKFIWTDHTRVDSMSDEPGKPRQLIVQLWYPAAPGATGAPAPYMLEYDALRSFLDQRPEFATDHAVFGSLITAARLEAPVAPSARAYPVVVFSHGLGMPRALYTSYCQNLASSGFIVAAIDHPGMGLVALPSGRVAKVYPPLGLDTPPGLREKPEEERDVYWKTEELYLGADQRFVLDQIVRLNRGEMSDRFRGRIDETKMAHIGHSRGFASITCAHDARVKACVNLEGSPQMSERRFGLPHPLLTLRSENRRGLISVIHTATRVPSYDIEIQGSNHNSVTDLGILGPPDRQEGAARYLKIISAYTIAFLDKTLHGGSAPALDSDSSEYPEAKLTRFDADGREIPRQSH